MTGCQQYIHTRTVSHTQEYTTNLSSKTGERNIKRHDNTHIANTQARAHNAQL